MQGSGTRSGASGRSLAALVAVVLGASLALAPPSSASTAGQRLFDSGGFENGGAACGSCHALADDAGLGAAQLAPRLDWVGVNWTPEVIAAWLAAPPTPTMAALYGKGSGDELSQSDRDQLGAWIALVGAPDKAALAVQANGATVAPHDVNWPLLGTGLAGAVGLLALVGLIWRNRVRSVRARMVRAARLPNT